MINIKFNLIDGLHNNHLYDEAHYKSIIFSFITNRIMLIQSLKYEEIKYIFI